MIQFKFQVTNQYVDWHEDKNHSDLEFEGVFEIIIDNEVFFFDEYFLVFEFLNSALKWMELDGESEMHYHCIDTNDNPLISFLPVPSHLWTINSPWQKFQCQTLFTKEELYHAIERLRQSTNLLHGV